MLTLGLRGCDVLEKCQNVELRNFVWGKCSVISLYIVSMGQKQMYLLLLC